MLLNNNDAPTSFTKRLAAGIDSAVEAIFPRYQLGRLQARQALEKTRLSYANARSGRDRSPPSPLQNPDSPVNQMDSLTMMRRAQDLDRDSSFMGHLAASYKMYALGSIQYIPKCGDKKIKEAYRQFFNNEWMSQSDAQGRFHFIDQMQLSLTGMLWNGHHGLIHHHNEDGTFQISSVPGYNIGNPRAVTTNKHLIRGLVINDAGQVTAYQLFKLELSGNVRFIAEIPASIFSHMNPVASTDEYVAKTPFHSVLNDAHDMKAVENAWMQKVKFFAWKNAIINTSNGLGPSASRNPNPVDDVYESPVKGRLVSYAPGETIFGDPGMTIEAIENHTPNPNEAEFLVTKMAQIATALHLPLAFVWVVMGLPGTYTRLISEQAKRAFQHGPFGQKWMERTCLNEIKNKALMSGILRGEIPYCEDWTRGEWLYPAHPTVDVGRESDANLQENRQGIKSMAKITGEEGDYWSDVDMQLDEEAQNKIRLAIDGAKRLTAETGVEVTWQQYMTHLQQMSPNQTSTNETPPEKPDEKAQ